MAIGQEIQPTLSCSALPSCCSLPRDGWPEEEHQQSEEHQRYAHGGKDEANAPKLSQHRAQWRDHQQKGVLDSTGRSEDAPE
jgi:hypothetical protein